MYAIAFTVAGYQWVVIWVVVLQVRITNSNMSAFTSDVAPRIQGDPLQEKCTVNGYLPTDPIFLDSGISTLVRWQEKICPFIFSTCGQSVHHMMMSWQDALINMYRFNSAYRSHKCWARQQQQKTKIINITNYYTHEILETQGRAMRIGSLENLIIKQ